MKNNLSRREFLRRVSLLTATVACGPLLTSELYAKQSVSRIIPANEKINLACIGIGNRAGDIIKEFNKSGHCNIVALCDTDMGAKHTLEIMKMFPDVEKTLKMTP